MGDELSEMLAPTVASSGLELVDVEVRPGLVRVVVDGPGGVALDAISAVTRAVSAELDRHDPFPGRRYTLEVTSPGLERPLRTPSQFARAVGETVTVRLVAGGPGERRVTGVLLSADDSAVVVEGEKSDQPGRRITYEEIERARTVFVWEAPARPGRRGSARRGRSGIDRERVTTP